MDMPCSPEKKGKGPDKWELESWVRTLTEAEEIKADPKKMKLIQPLLKTKVAAIKSLADLRTLAVEKEPDEDDAE